MTEELQYMACLTGLSPEAKAAFDELARSRSAAERGRALCFLGRAAEGRKLLQRAAAADPKARAWLGEERLLAGDAAAALPHLEAAARALPDWPWGRLLHAVCLLSLGDADAAERQLSGQSAPARAVRALIEAQKGRAKAGIAALGNASGPLLAVRALLRRGEKDLPGALEDLRQAGESPWILMQRADVRNRLGFYKDALKDLERAAELAPDSPHPPAAAANVLFDQAYYPEALAELEKALKLAPEDAGLIARRGRMRLTCVGPAEAAADLARAVELAPNDPQLRFELAQARILADKKASLDGVLAPFDEFLRAYELCRRGKRKEASRRFEKVAASATGGFAERCRFYALVARVLDEAQPRRAKKGPLLHLCGIGIHHPYQATAEIIRALGECSVLYNNLGDPQVIEFLGLFGARVKSVTRVFNEPATGRVNRLMDELRSDCATGFVTRIHPFIYRRIANDLVVECEKREVPYKAYGAVSLTEVSAGQGAGGSGRLRVFDVTFLARNPKFLSPFWDTVVYCIAGEAERRALCAELRKRFPAEHPVYLLAGSGDREQQVLPSAVALMEPILLSMDLGTVLYVPSVTEKLWK